MIVQQDTRQKKKHHVLKEQWFEKHGIKVVNSKCIVGDYIIPADGSVSVDTKKDISELYSDLVQQHSRFKAECELAQELGIKLYILVENTDNVTCVEDITKWKNPQYLVWLKKQRQGIKCRQPVSNVQLKKMMWTMSKRYDVTFLFCRPLESAEKILRLLLKVEDNEPTPFPERE